MTDRDTTAEQTAQQPGEPSPPVAAPMRRKSGLGRGLGALLGDSLIEEPLALATASAAKSDAADGAAIAGGAQTAGRGLAHLAIASIIPNPDQPRRHFDDAALDELAASIASRGVIQPIIVRPLGDGNYQLVAGERRWRAAQRAKLHEIPALVRALDDREVMALALIENIQRADLNPVEEATAYRNLAETQGYSHQDIARLVDKSRSHVANLIRLMALPPSVLSLVADGRLSMGHARALINAPMAATLAHDVAARGLSVRVTERLVRQASRQGDGGKGEATARRSRSARDSSQDADIAIVQRHLEDLLGLKVAIISDADPRSGQVTIRYSTLDQLDLICQRLSGGNL